MLTNARVAAIIPVSNLEESIDQQGECSFVLKPSELVPLKPVSITPVGYYAYRIAWSDGHDSGIYTLEHLRELCQCPECSKV